MVITGITSQRAGETAEALKVLINANTVLLSQQHRDLHLNDLLVALEEAERRRCRTDSSALLTREKLSPCPHSLPAVTGAGCTDPVGPPG